MALVNQNLPIFYGGVSQQAKEIRLDNQCDEMINFIPSISQGLQRRLPTNILTEIENVSGEPYLYTYERDDNEKYIILLFNGYWKVYDYLGNFITEGTDDYLNCTNPSIDLECITIKDATFVLNKTKKTKMNKLIEENIVTVEEHTYRPYINKLLIDVKNRPGDFKRLIGTLSLKLTIDGVNTISSTYYNELVNSNRWTIDTETLNYTNQAKTLLTNAINASGDTNFVYETGQWIYRDTEGHIIDILISFEPHNNYDYYGVISSSDYDVFSDDVGYNVTDTSNWDNYFYYWIKKSWDDGNDTGWDYTVYLNGSQLATTNNTDSEEAINSLQTTLSGLGYPTVATGSVLRILNDNPTSKVFSGGDSWGDQASFGFSSKATSINELPNSLGFEGAVIEIVGNESNAVDNYYVKFEDGIYKETVKPGTSFKLNPDTMPHKLIRGFENNGVTPKFYFLPIDGIEFIDEANNILNYEEDFWKERLVGDETTNPNPTFINNTIDSIFFFKNRLGFLSGESIILSETNELYNYFVTTITDTLDTDMIDVEVDTRNTLKLRYAIPYQKDLLLFGDNAQFILSSTGALSSKTINVQQTTSFDFNSLAKPEALGPNVYFTTNKNSSTKVREYYITPDTITNDAADITTHIPHYIPTNIKTITGTTKYDVLFFLSKENNRTIYVYNYLWENDTKSQSAWHKWTFQEDIKNIKILGNKLLILFGDDEDMTLKEILLETPEDISSIDYADHIGNIESEGDVYAFYESYFKTSEWAFPGTNSGIDDFRKILTLKNVEINSGLGSYYNLQTFHNQRSNSIVDKTIFNDNNKTNKFRVAGKSKDLTIIVRSVQDKGMKLLASIFEGNYNSKSRGI